MIIAHNLKLSFGSQDIFNNISFTIQPNQTIGLVGRNGSGKSTLLKVIAGLQPVHDGTLSIQKNKTIAYMPQDVVLNSPLSILDEVLSAFKELHKLKTELCELEQRMSAADCPHDVLERYSTIQQEILDLNPILCEVEAKKMLYGLGFSEQQLSQPVAQLSTGWKMRIVLAKLLLARADFYLFDEPTNHLDLQTKDWFMNFLKNAPFGFLLVCHERYFLDAVCNQILELEHNVATRYNGNYSSYEQQKEHNKELLERAYEHQQKEIKRKQEIIDKFRAGTRAKAAQSMMKALDKIERVAIPPAPKEIAVTFPPLASCSKQVLSVKNIAYGFDDTLLFADVTFDIERGEKVAIVAPNGAGKTTLFNVLTGKYSKKNGTITFGNNVSYALFDQDQQAVLNLDDTIFNNISTSCRSVPDQTIRNFLGSFLFSNDEIHKKVGVLSGGEKNRVGMVRVLLQNANLLFLDEPTNHLDIASKELLLSALQKYPGTIIFVSHDRSFVNSLATRILELSDKKILSYQGNYDDYMTHKNYAQTITANTAPKQHSPQTQSPKTVSGDSHNAFEINKKIKAVERLIEKTEREIERLEQKFVDLVYGSAPYTTAQQSLAQLTKHHQELMSQWETLQSALIDT